MEGVSQVRQLDGASVHRLTSGQVVIDLQSAIKELVENALDGGARTIEVRLKNFGLDSIEVVDDGSGIPEGDFAGIALKHHTSKLSKFEDLTSVASFGFRGEALSSLCALSDSLEITTATKELAPQATLLKFKQSGELMDGLDKVARPRGTTVTVNKIFSSIPVRRQELEKHSKREFGKALTLLTAYALVPASRAPGVRLSVVSLVKGGKKTSHLRTDGTQSLRASISSVWGPKSLDDLVDIDEELTVSETGRPKGDAEPVSDIIVRLTGVISSSAQGKGRSSGDRQFLFINGRPCNATKVQKAINEVYRSHNTTQTPFSVLNLELPPGQPSHSCDINVSPDKRTIFLHNELGLLQSLRNALEKVYSPTQSVYAAADALPSPPRPEPLFLPSDESFEAALVKTRSSSPVTAPSSPLPERPLPKVKAPVVSSRPMAPASASASTSRSNAQPTLASFLQRLPSLSRPDPPRKRKELSPSPPIAAPPTGSARPRPADSPSLLDKDEIVLDKDEDDDMLEDEDPQPPRPPPVLLPPRDEVDDARRHASASQRMTFSLPNILLAVSQASLPAPTSTETPISAQLSAEAAALAGIANADAATAEASLQKIIIKGDFGTMDVVGQYNRGFIIARKRTSGADDLFIIDQHAADEKVNFETLQQTTNIQSQKLIHPRPLDLSASDAMVALENVDVLRKNGFEVVSQSTDQDDSPRLALDSQPISRETVFDFRDLEELLHLMQDRPTGEMVRCSKARKMFAMRACRKSIMVGRALSHSQMLKVVRSMGTIDQPWNCPHGRPTMRHLANLDGQPARRAPRKLDWDSL